MPNYRRSPTQRLRRLRTPQCRSGDFRHALRLLGWSQAKAAVELGVSSEYVISDWSRGVRAVPMYIQQHLRFRLGLAPGDEWPVPAPKRHRMILPPGLRPMTPPGEE